MRRCLFALVLALPVPLAAAARGASLASGPFLVDTSQSINCLFSNLGTKPLRDLAVEVVRFEPGATGEVVQATTAAALPPLYATHSAKSNSGGTAFYVCRFSWRGSGRGSAHLYSSGGELLGALPAQ